MGAQRTTSARAMSRRNTSVDDVIETISSAGQLMAVPDRRREVLVIVSVAATALLTLAFISHDSAEHRNLVGPIGAGLADLLIGAVGLAAWLLPLELSFLTLRLFRGKRAFLGLATTVAAAVIVVIGCSLLHLVMGEARVHGGLEPGGLLGEVVGEVMRSLLGTAGAYVVGVALLLVTIVLRTPVSLVASVQGGAGFVAARTRRGGEWLREFWAAWREARELERAERDAARDAEREANKPKITWAGEASPVSHDAYEEMLEDESLEPVEAEPDDEVNTLDDQSELEAAVEEIDDEIESTPAPSKKTKIPKATKARKATKGAKGSKAPNVEPERAAEETAPKIVAPRASREVPKRATLVADDRGDFELPPLELLQEPASTSLRIEPATLRANAERLVEKLESYGVKGRVDEIHPGPVVTMYEFEPKSGTKISKIAGLEGDLAMALAAQKVRIVAPIPGKARVGIELPNEHRQTVFLREILDDARWQKHKGALPVALGKDIAGQPVYADLAKMPHLLVAGATGSGKSVGVNVMLASLLTKKSPEELKFLMIDPKVVELKDFDGIPHMLLPVVTDMNKASLALRWAVDEMERRYQLFAEAHARNIASFNRKVDRCLAGEIPAEKVAPSKAGKIRGTDEKGREVWTEPTDGEVPPPFIPEKLPYIVVVVDEFADLMMVAAKDVESAIARLAQKARAAGIHVILATQRPSVDVITGMIKANFPARMGFRVTSRQDSQTILGRQGAENLLGRGDMLMIPPGSSDLHRVHGAFIDEGEVLAVCDHLREQGNPVYDESILKPREDDGGGAGGDSSDDPLYDKGVAAVAAAGYCSISHLQRQLGIGYNKAAKLVDKMEAEGVVGPASRKAGGRREVLISAV